MKSKKFQSISTSDNLRIQCFWNLTNIDHSIYFGGDLSLRMFWQCPKTKLLEYFLIPLGCIRPSLATTMTFMAVIGFLRLQCDGVETSRGFFLSGMKCVLMGQMLRLCK